MVVKWWPEWWPVDKVIIPYLLVTGGLLTAFFRRIPEAWWLLALHVIAIAVFLVMQRNEAFHCWYPLPYVASCYKEMAILIPPIRHCDFDVEMSGLDARVWGTNPAVWLAHHGNAAITEFLQIAYSLFIPAVLVVAWLLWRQGKRKEFRYYAFLIAVGFLASYLGYLVIPVRGPRFLLPDLPPLRGLWLTPLLQHTLDRLESAHYDCFPSGHTELTLLACWGSRMVSSRLFCIFLIYTPCIIFATVYLRYHYTLDVLAGAVLALVLIAASPHIYTILGKRGQ